MSFGTFLPWVTLAASAFATLRRDKVAAAIIINKNNSFDVSIAPIVHESIHVRNSFLTDYFVKILETIGAGGYANTGREEDKVYDIINRLNGNMHNIYCCNKKTGLVRSKSYSDYDKILEECGGPKVGCSSLGKDWQ